MTMSWNGTNSITSMALSDYETIKEALLHTYFMHYRGKHSGDREKAKRARQALIDMGGQTLPAVDNL